MRALHALQVTGILAAATCAAYFLVAPRVAAWKQLDQSVSSMLSGGEAALHYRHEIPAEHREGSAELGQIGKWLAEDLRGI